MSELKVPSPTPVDPKLHRALVEAQNDMLAVEQMMQMFQQNCQARIAAARRKAQEAWADIQRQTGIDVKGVAWEHHPTDPVVIPVQMRLQGS